MADSSEEDFRPSFDFDRDLTLSAVLLLILLSLEEIDTASDESGRFDDLDFDDFLESSPFSTLFKGVSFDSVLLAFSSSVDFDLDLDLLGRVADDFGSFDIDLLVLFSSDLDLDLACRSLPRISEEPSGLLLDFPSSTGTFDLD